MKSKSKKHLQYFKIMFRKLSHCLCRTRYLRNTPSQMNHELHEKLSKNFRYNSPWSLK